MQYKKLIVLAIVILSLLAISTVSANENQTIDVVSTDLGNEDIPSVDDSEIEDVSYDFTDEQEVLAVSEDDDEVSLNNDNEILTGYYPYYSEYSVDVEDTIIFSGSSGSISMSIDPSTSSTYKYYYYLRVYDSSGNQKISSVYYSQSNSYSKTYSLSSGQLSAGTYTIKIINYNDNRVMDTATLTVKSGSAPYYPYYDDYSVDVYDATVYSDDGGSISMSIDPCTFSTYKYYYYFRVYDSSGNQKISTTFSSRYGDTIETYYLDSDQLSPGRYTVKIINYDDKEVMSTATLTVKSGSAPYYPYYDDYSVDVYDNTITYGEIESIYMSIAPSISSNYAYYYYFRVYDSSGNQKISKTFYSRYSDTGEYYYLSSNQLSPGRYTVKIINYADDEEMSTATLTVLHSSVINSSDSTYIELKDTISYASSGSLINLANDIDFDESAYNPIYISKTLIIDGHGHTIDAKEFSRIFSISGSDVVLKNIIFKNAFSSYNDGGAIYWSGSNGKLINCTFIGNNASNQNGGAVYWSASYANITDCTFVNNSAYYGGAVYLSGSSSTINNCEFTSNSAGYQGGGLHIISSSTIENSNFNTNDAEYGGAISIGNSYTVNMNECNFNNNSADYGSAIKWYYSMGTATNCTFNGTKANSHKHMYISSRLYPDFDMDVEDIVLGEKLNLTIDWTDDLQGNMTIDIFSERLNKTVYSAVKQLDGLSKSINLLIPNLKTSDYILEVTYSGDNIYSDRTITDYFEVIGYESNITFTVQNITWGTPIVLNPKVTTGATGFIYIYVNDEYIDTFAVGSKYNLFGVSGPSSEIELVYSGDDNYRSCSSTQTAYVERLNSSLTLPEKFVSAYSTVELVFNEDATGYVRITFADRPYQGYLANGTFKFSTSNKVASGSQYLSIDYGGDGKYNPLNTYYYVNVEIQVPTLELNLANVKYGNNVVVKPYINGATGYFEIYVDDNYKTSVSNGGSYTIKSPDLGKHEVRVVYSGDSYYAMVENTTAFRVYSFYPIEVENTKIIHNSDKYLKATFYDEYGKYLSNKKVLFNVNGTNYYRDTDEKGLAILDENFEIGIYPLIVTNINVNEKYYTTLTVFTSIIAENMSVYYNSGYDFNATFLDLNAKPLINSIVLFDVNGTIYDATTDKDGQAKLVVPLPVGTYEITSMNSETDEVATNMLTVVTSIISEDMSRVYNSSMDYKATFYDVDGSYLTNQTVIFEIGTTQYKVATDFNGQAILNVGLAKGEYNITSINPATNQRSINKLTILERIINNNDVIVFGNEETYYRVRVIDDNAVVCGAGQTVAFKINGKRFEIKTASDGYAYLKITESAGIYDVTASYKGYTVENEVIVLGNVPSLLTVGASDINYGQMETLNVTVNPEYLHGNVTIFVNGSNGYEKLLYQKASQTIIRELSNLNASSYQVTAVYSDFDNLYFSKTTKSFKVSKATPDIIVTCEGAEYGENSTITVNIQKASGNVTIKVGDKTYTENIITDGVVIKRISDIRPGNYSVSVTYNGNNNFNKASKTAKLEVSKGSIGLFTSVANVIYGQDVIAKVYSSFAGKVTLKVGKTTKTVDVGADKEYSVNFGKLNAGKYTMNSDIVPTDNNYLSDSDAASFEVAKANVNLGVTAENIDVGQATKITVTLPSGLDGNIKLQLDGKEYNQTTSSTKTIFGITGIKAGKYNIKATFNGNTNYNAASKNTSFEVKKVSNIPISIPTAISNSDYVFTCDLPKDATGKVTVSINGNNYTANVANGKANIPLPQLTDGTYQYTLKYSGNDKYNAYSKSGVITVKDSKGTVIVVYTGFSRYATDYYAGERGSNFYGTLYDVDGKPLSGKTVQIAVNGVLYDVVTDSKGQAGLQVNLAAANTYTYALFFPGDKTYNASLIASSKLTVVKKPTSIIANNMAFKTSAKTKTVSVALNTIKNPFDGKMYLKTGKTLTLTVGGKTYTAKTTTNGVAKFNIKLTKKGIYNAVIKFKGDSSYKEVSKSIKIIVSDSPFKNTALKGVGVGMDSAKLTNPSTLNVVGDFKDYLKENTITSNENNNKKDTVIVVDKTFSRVATDYYAGERGALFYATLKDSDGKVLAGKTVQIAVNGPIYTVTTDSRGRAGLQVNLAAANTYTYALVFSGDDSYNPAPLASSKLTVTKKVTSISASAVSFKSSAKTKTVSVTLKTSKNPYDQKTYLKSGKKLTLKVNGKTYAANINVKGIAKFNIKLTKKGKYTAKIKFAGDSTYKATSKSIKILIK